ncbi:MAG: TIGR03915 family putative DNA repair protein [Weeksellaceae bacterium]
MTYLIYDGTFEGFLSAVFDAYDLKLKEVQIKKEQDDLPDLFAQKIYVATVEEKSERVKKKLVDLLGNNGFKNLWKVTLSELPTVEEVLWGVIQYAIKQNKNVLNDYGHLHVIQLNDILKKLSRERHRMTAFIRFQQAADGIYYATIEPDFDVLPLISNHFRNRYADQKWLIYDMRRNYAIYYDLNTVTPLEIQGMLRNDKAKNLPATLIIDWDETEKEFQKLWQNYFKSTNIKSRKNTKLHLQHVPKRYWKYLTEKH